MQPATSSTYTAIAQISPFRDSVASRGCERFPATSVARDAMMWGQYRKAGLLATVSIRRPEPQIVNKSATRNEKLWVHSRGLMVFLFDRADGARLGFGPFSLRPGPQLGE